MKAKNTILIAAQVYKTVFKNRSTWVLFVLMLIMVVYAGVTSWQYYQTQQTTIVAYQQKARESWESNPDKHPHRMAHYGSFAFRPKYPLSFFDMGIENYTGNTVFLEAHKQNTVNFSEAGFSSGILRFGEISLALIVQLLFPLLLFFLGFGLVAAERENGTLNVLVSQGASWKEILSGKSLGLYAVMLSFLVPVLLTLAILLFLTNNMNNDVALAGRTALMLLLYGLYLWILSVITVCISAISRTSRQSLLRLIGVWLLLLVLLPRGLQSLGGWLYPAPSKLAFEAAIEEEVVKQGDSHNPDDPHYKHLKDSVLKVYCADSVQQLPFNYSGFVMREGEKISAIIYSQHQNRLWEVYQKQNKIAAWAAFVNPFMAVRNLSMSLAGSDFSTYTDFQQQAEKYRYELAQHMNELQMEYISNKKPGPDDQPYTISSKHWQETPDFVYRNRELSTVLGEEKLGIAAILFWLIILALLVQLLSKKLKVV